MNRLMWFLLFLGALMYAAPFALGQQHEGRQGVGNRLLKTEIDSAREACGFFNEPVRPAARLMGTSRLRPLAGRDADSQRLASLSIHK
jgi:hypothetical protein